MAEVSDGKEFFLDFSLVSAISKCCAVEKVAWRE